MVRMILVGIAIFIVLLIVVAFGEVAGGSWQLVSVGVTKFIIIITVFAYALFILVKVVGRR